MHDRFDHAAQTGRRVAFAGIVASALLATLNIVVGIITRSTSVVATGVEFAGHIQVDPNLTVATSHVISGRVRAHVREQLGWVADVLVHAAPLD
jgi:divalent metal cation (Fe/Co/Zn/Cd) transporter